MRTFRLSPGSHWDISLKKDKLALLAIAAWLPLFLISLIYLIVNFSALPALVPLFYSRPWGEDQLAPKLYLWVLPLGNFLLAIFNLSFATALHKTNQFLSRILLGVTPVISLLCTYSLVAIINLIR